jgi:glycosyltransferase involved in cell wall biosynthesis
LIIALDARPLATGQVTGAEQFARNVVREWAAASPPDVRFLLLLDRRQAELQHWDLSFIEQLPPQFEAVSLRVLGEHPWLPHRRVFGGLSRVLSRRGVDVFLSFTASVPYTRACPVVQTIHDMAAELDLSVRDTPAGRALRHATRAGARWASYIVTVSSQTRADVISLYGVPPQRVSVVFNGINPVFNTGNDLQLSVSLRQRYQINSQYILAVGSDIPRRNYGRLYLAMRMFWEKRPRIKLLLAGRSPWQDSPIYQRVQEGGDLGRCIFAVSPTDLELAQLYRDALCTCCASSFEGFGMSVLEALACGNPVACSDMRSLREVAADAAIYFAHDDQRSICEALMGLAEDPDYRRQLRTRGFARARLFSWSSTAQELLKVLRRAAALPGADVSE